MNTSLEPTFETPIPLGRGIFVSPDLYEVLFNIVSEGRLREAKGQPKLSYKEMEARVGMEYKLFSSALAHIYQADKLAEANRYSSHETARRATLRPGPNPDQARHKSPMQLPEKRDARGKIVWESVKGYESDKEVVRRVANEGTMEEERQQRAKAAAASAGEPCSIGG